MHHTGNTVFSAMYGTGVLPVLHAGDLYAWQNVIDLCHQCGIRAIEFRDTLSGKGIYLFQELVSYASQYPEFYLGVSTLQRRIATRYIQGGASFLTSSFLKEDMAAVAHDYNIPWIPGCSDTVEISFASQRGAAAVSLLPGSLTPAELKVLRNGYRGLAFIPSAGVMMKHEALKEWVAAGVMCVRIPSTGFSAQRTGGKSHGMVEQNILSVISIVKNARTSARTYASVPE